MSEINKMVGKLVELGLTEYEARAYLALLIKGSMGASELALASGVPRVKVYEAINGLVKKGLVEVYGRPRKFSVVSDPAPLTSLLENEERRYKELKSVVNEIRGLSQKKGVTSARGSFVQLSGLDALETMLNDIMKRVREKLYIIANDDMLSFVKKYERQLINLAVEDVGVFIIIPYDQDMISDAMYLQLPVYIAGPSIRKGIAIMDDAVMLVFSEETNTTTVVSLPPIIKMMRESVAEPLIRSSVEIKEYMRVYGTGLFDDYSILKGSLEVYQELLRGIINSSSEETLRRASGEALKGLASKFPLKLFSSDIAAGVPVFVELIRSSMPTASVKFDETAKMLTIEYEGDSPMPLSPWLLLFGAYLRSAGKDLQLVSRINTGERTIVQYKIPYELEELFI